MAKLSDFCVISSPFLLKKTNYNLQLCIDAHIGGEYDHFALDIALEIPQAPICTMNASIRR